MMFLSHKCFTIAVFTVFLNITFSQNFQSESDLYSHLYEINKEWANYPNACPDGKMQFDSDNDRIQAHLELVIAYLRSNTRKHLSAKQHENRAHLLDALAIYASQKIFPTNTFHSIRTPYFVDEKGIHCAVGQLMHVSGNDDLVASIQQNYNYNYIADIKTKGITEWCNEYGFTIEELKWIQPGYSPAGILKEAGEGTNGPINKIHLDTIYDRLIIAGSFDTISELPCLNIGQFSNNQFSCLGAGLVGTVYDVTSSGSTVVAFGDFQSNGSNFPIALFNGASWSYYAHPLPNAKARAGFTSGIYSEMAIESPTFQGQEIWTFNFSTNIWTRIAKTNGPVQNIITSTIGRVYAGHFSTVITFTNQIDTLQGINNVIINQNNSNPWFGLSSQICDTVKTICEINGNLYFAGSCSGSTSPVCMASYDGSSLTTLLNSADISPYTQLPFYTSINSICLEDQNNILVGGNFQVSYGLTHGMRLGRLRISDNLFRPLAVLNGSVNAVSIYQSDLFVGGEFTANGGLSMNYLAQSADPVSIDKVAFDNKIEVFPVPFNNQITLEGVTENINYTITNSLGQIVKSGILTNQKINNLEVLEAGVYILQLNTKSGIVSKTIIK